MRKRWFLAVWAFFLFLVLSPVHAEHPAGLPVYMNGEKLTELCRAFMRVNRSVTVTIITEEMLQDYRNGAKCQGYVEGVYDSASMGRLFASKAICAPDNLSLSSLTEVVATFSDQNPALRNRAGYELVIMAFASSFPCSK
jgi:hypothetical protein